MNSKGAGLSQMDKLQRIQRVLDEWRRRRSVGDEVSVSDLINSNRDLMPELGYALRSSDPNETVAATLPLDDSSRPRQRDAQPAPEIDGYEILGELKRGGQGTVFRAIQLATGREVALKVLLGGMLAGGAARMRLRREVELLGQIRHPHVVTVFDSGESHGVLYYAMDYIPGQDLSDYLKLPGLQRSELLRLFTEICDGLHAAHVKGIIHRDVKPSNVRVDTNGKACVVDFGLARELSSSAVDRLTEQGQFLGSIKWAAPEHFTGDTDTRSDVYSLGVMLYETFTGREPYKLSGSVRDRAKDEQTVRETEPPAPRRVKPGLDPELEAIILSCLIKEPERRYYQNAGDLARDLRSYSAGLPIAAKGQSWSYLAWKLVRRNWLRASAFASAAVLLVAYAVSMTLMFQAVTRERENAQRVATVFQSTIESLEPERAAGAEWTPLHQSLLDGLLAADEQLAALVDFPEVEAEVRGTIGRALVTLDKPQEARRHLARAVELNSALRGNKAPETLEDRHYLAWAVKEDGAPDEAEQLYAAVLADRRATLGDEHLAVAATLNNLGQLYREKRDFAQAEPLLREALQIRTRLRARGEFLAASEANLGSLLRERGGALTREAGQGGGAPADPAGREAARALLDESATRLEQALQMRQALFGERDFRTVVSMNMLGLLKRERAALRRGDEDAAGALSDLEASLAILQRAHDLRLAVLPLSHRHISVSKINLGIALNELERYGEAEPYLRDALQRFVREEDPIGIERSAQQLHHSLVGQERPAEADAALQAALRDLQSRIDALPPERHEQRAALERTASQIETLLGAPPR